MQNLNGRKLQFLSGSQASIQAMISGQIQATEGAFYLTEDTHRLYVGADSTIYTEYDPSSNTSQSNGNYGYYSDGHYYQNNTTLPTGVTRVGDKTYYKTVGNVIPVPVNAGIEQLPTIESLPIIATNGEKPSNGTPTFYYIEQGNILCIYGEIKNKYEKATAYNSNTQYYSFNGSEYVLANGVTNSNYTNYYTHEVQYGWIQINSDTYLTSITPQINRANVGTDNEKTIAEFVLAMNNTNENNIGSFSLKFDSKNSDYLNISVANDGLSFEVAQMSLAAVTDSNTNGSLSSLQLNKTLNGNTATVATVNLTPGDYMEKIVATGTGSNTTVTFTGRNQQIKDAAFETDSTGTKLIINQNTKYTKTNDTEVDNTKEYYTLSKGVYTKVSSPKKANLSQYYEAINKISSNSLPSITYGEQGTENFNWRTGEKLDVYSIEEINQKLASISAGSMSSAAGMHYKGVLSWTENDENEASYFQLVDVPGLNLVYDSEIEVSQPNQYTNYANSKFTLATFLHQVQKRNGANYTYTKDRGLGNSQKEIPFAISTLEYQNGTFLPATSLTMSAVLTGTGESYTTTRGSRTSNGRMLYYQDPVNGNFYKIDFASDRFFSTTLNPDFTDPNKNYYTRQNLDNGKVQFINVTELVSGTETYYELLLPITTPIYYRTLVQSGDIFRLGNTMPNAITDFSYFSAAAETLLTAEGADGKLHKGDLLILNSDLLWDVVPSGDEPSYTFSGEFGTLTRLVQGRLVGEYDSSSPYFDSTGAAISSPNSTNFNKGTHYVREDNTYLDLVLEDNIGTKNTVTLGSDNIIQLENKTYNKVKPDFTLEEFTCPTISHKTYIGVTPTDQYNNPIPNNYIRVVGNKSHFDANIDNEGNNLFENLTDYTGPTAALEAATTPVGFSIISGLDVDRYGHITRLNAKTIRQNYITKIEAENNNSGKFKANTVLDTYDSNLVYYTATVGTNGTITYSQVGSPTADNFNNYYIVRPAANIVLTDAIGNTKSFNIRSGKSNIDLQFSQTSGTDIVIDANLRWGKF